MKTEEHKKIWQEQYLNPMIERFKDIPQAICYALIKKDYSRMFGGKKEAEERMNYMYYNEETFLFALDNAIAELSKRVKKTLVEKTVQNEVLPMEYIKLKESGMMRKLFPNFSGLWGKDREQFLEFWWERENKKGWLNKIL